MSDFNSHFDGLNGSGLPNLFSNVSDTDDEHQCLINKGAPFPNSNAWPPTSCPAFESQSYQNQFTSSAYYQAHSLFPHLEPQPTDTPFIAPQSTASINFEGHKSQQLTSYIDTQEPGFTAETLNTRTSHTPIPTTFLPSNDARFSVFQSSPSIRVCYDCNSFHRSLPIPNYKVQFCTSVECVFCNHYSFRAMEQPNQPTQRSMPSTPISPFRPRPLARLAGRPTHESQRIMPSIPIRRIQTLPLRLPRAPQRPNTPTSGLYYCHVSTCPKARNGNGFKRIGNRNAHLATKHQEMTATSTRRHNDDDMMEVDEP